MQTYSHAPLDRLITVARAVQLAAEKGTPVSPNTVMTAAKRGNIMAAVKPRGRWMFPAWAFEDWLAVHVHRRDYNHSRGG